MIALLLACGSQGDSASALLVDVSPRSFALDVRADGVDWHDSDEADEEVLLGQVVVTSHEVEPLDVVADWDLPVPDDYGPQAQLVAVTWGDEQGGVLVPGATMSLDLYAVFWFENGTRLNQFDEQRYTVEVLVAGEAFEIDAAIRNREE